MKMEHDSKLRYSDDADRCHGLAGMAMGVVLWDAREMLAGIDADAPVGSMMQFTPQYYFAGNPRLSARLAWNQIVRQYRLTTGMVLSNVLCRHMVYRHSDVPADALHQLVEELAAEGRDVCSLEDDELGALFNDQLRYLTRLYRHSGVQGVVRDFVATLQQRRRMTMSEILEALRPLDYI